MSESRLSDDDRLDLSLVSGDCADMDAHDDPVLALNTLPADLLSAVPRSALPLAEVCESASHGLQSAADVPQANASEDAASAESAPAESASMDSASMDSASTNSAAVNSAAVNSASTDSAPGGLQIEIVGPGIPLAIGTGERGRTGSRRPHRNSGAGEMLKHLVGVVGGGFLGLAIAYYGLNYFGGPEYNFLNIPLPGVPQSITANAPPNPNLPPQPVNPAVPAPGFDQQPAPPVGMIPNPPGGNAAQMPFQPVNPQASTQGWPPPEHTGAEIKKAAADFQRAWKDNWTEPDWQAIDKVAVCVTFARSDVRPAEIRGAITGLRTRLGLILNQPDEALDCNTRAWQQLTQPAEDLSGMVIVGKVISSEKVAGQEAGQAPAGGRPGPGSESNEITDLWAHVVELEPAPGARENYRVPVLSRLPAPFAVGDQVCCLGVLMHEPASKLRVYKGDDARVLWGGFCAVKNAKPGP